LQPLIVQSHKRGIAIRLTTGEGPSIVEQTAGIFRQRQDGSQGEIDFERARQAFMDYFATRAKDEVTDSQAQFLRDSSISSD